MDGFFIISLDDAMEREKRFFSQAQRRSCNELFLVTSGYVIRDCNFNSIRINKNELHLSLSRQITVVKDYSPDLQGYYFRFEDTFLEQAYLRDSLEKELEFISSFLFRYPLRLTARIAEQLVSNCSRMIQLHQDIQPDPILIHAYLAASIFELKKLMSESHLNLYPSKAFLTTKRYNDLLAAFADRERSIDFYARQLEITPNHLNKSVKAATGRTAISLLNEMSILDAKMRLNHTNQTISEIAFQLGFEDQSYFSRFFKKATGLTPSEYRKENEKQ